MRIRSCFNGHQAQMLATPDSRHVLTCPLCEVSTHLHATIEGAAAEWNSSRNPIWRRYEITRWLWLFRWWHGYNL